MLRNAQRVVGIAGGPGKNSAILGALRGRWIDVLITDKHTADKLMSESSYALKAKPALVRKTK